MLRRVALISTLMVLAFGPATAESLDEILKKFYDARGGLSNLAAVESARITGRYEMTGAAEAAVRMEWKRPDRLRLEIGAPGDATVEGFDGETAWVIPPEGLARKAPAEVADDIRSQADLIDGPLVDWQAKGNRVTYLGPGELDGAAVRKLGLVRQDGTAETVFLDAETFLPTRRRGTERARGEPVEIDVHISDYRKVGELTMAHTIKTELTEIGVTQWLRIDAVELNVEIPDERFAPPPAAD